MSDLSVVQIGDVLVVDSRLIANRLGIEHENFMKTVVKYQTKIEQRFGVIRFESGKPLKGSLGGRPEKFAYLTESQATTLMTFSKNTEQVVECKLDLVEAFWNAKAIIAGTTPKTPASFAEALRLAADKQEEIERQAALLEEQKPKVQAYDVFIDSDNWYTSQQAAQIIAVPKFGQRNLMKWLREKKILTDDNRPYQDWVNKGLAKVNTNESGFPYTVFSPRGLERIKDLLAQSGHMVAVRQQEIITYRHNLTIVPKVEDQDDEEDIKKAS